MHNSTFRTRFHFTLVELLVVVSIIAILAALLLPSLRQARFRAKVIGCTSQFRQWGFAIGMYAGDNGGFLPRFDFPATGRNPTDVANEFLPAMAEYGANWQTWFCPAQPEHREMWLAFVADGEPYNNETVAVALRYYYNPFFTKFPYSWWVPRKSGILYPTGYPTGGGDDTVTAGKPLMTDALYSGTTTDPLETQNHGHRIPEYGGTLKSVNALYVDGSVKTIPPADMEARYAGTGGWWSFW